MNYNIHKYKKIAIYGVNKFFDVFLLEFAILGKLKSIVAVIDEKILLKDYQGIPVVSIENVKNDIDCLVINKRRTESNIRDVLDNEKFDIVDVYDIDKFIPYNLHPELERYKNLHKGKRIFIIGNGPSLRIQDLETLKNNGEICFGLNKIYLAYKLTEWRADYICVADGRVINSAEKYWEEISKNSTIFMADKYCFGLIEKKDYVKYVHLKSEYYSPNLPGFSENIVEGVYWGWSTTYDLAMQIAAYMGAKEIYLIGMDHSNIGVVTDERNHFIKGYFSEDDIKMYGNVRANFSAIELAYKKAEFYSRTHGFRIFNATRGGKLEVFERVDFDDLFSEE